MIHGLWGLSIGSKVQLISTLAGGITVSMVYSWRCGLVTLACMPAFFFLLAISTILLKSFGAEDDNAIKAEALTNIRTVISLNLQDVMIERYVAHVSKLDHQQRFNAYIKSFHQGGLAFTMFSIMALIAWYSGKLISDSTNDFLEVMIAQQAVMTAMRGIGEANEMSSKFADAANVTRRVFFIIDRQPQISAAPPPDMSASANDDGALGTAAGNAPDSFDDHMSPSMAKHTDLSGVDLRGIKFRYPARPEAPLLRGVELTLDMSHTYGLMGETGCGKSTLIGLLKTLRPSRWGNHCPFPRRRRARCSPSRS